MTPQELRLECLKLAQAQCAIEKRIIGGAEVAKIAAEFYTFVDQGGQPEVKVGRPRKVDKPADLFE